MWITGKKEGNKQQSAKFRRRLTFEYIVLAVAVSSSARFQILRIPPILGFHPRPT